MHVSLTETFSCLVFQVEVWYLLPWSVSALGLWAGELQGPVGQEWRIKFSQPTYCSEEVTQQF